MIKTASGPAAPKPSMFSCGKKVRPLLIVAVALVASAAAHAPHAGTATPDQIAYARDALDSHLDDVTTARFRNVHFMDVDYAKLFCGEVNAKNKFGAYTGWKTFFVHSAKSNFSTMDGEVVLEGVETPASEFFRRYGPADKPPVAASEQIHNVCVKNGKPLDTHDYTHDLSFAK